MFLVILLFALLMVVVLITLPLFSGLIKYEKNPNYSSKKQQKQKQKQQSTNHNNYSSSSSSYVAPDEGLSYDDLANSEASGSRREKLKTLGTGVYQKLKDIDNDDIPVRIQLANESTLKKRTTKKNLQRLDSMDRDPNNYDYDLDELIEEEQVKDKIDLTKNLQSLNQDEFSSV